MTEQTPDYGVTCGFVRFCDRPHRHEGEHGAWVETTVERIRNSPVTRATVEVYARAFAEAYFPDDRWGSLDDADKAMWMQAARVALRSILERDRGIAGS